jgi:hypothetical protein
MIFKVGSRGRTSLPGQENSGSWGAFKAKLFNRVNPMPISYREHSTESGS